MVLQTGAQSVADVLSVDPSPPLKGRIRAPGDKSITHRALLCAALAAGESDICGSSDAEDCRATRLALEALGVQIKAEGQDHYRVYGRGGQLQAPQTSLDLRNSGTSMRLLCGVLGTQTFNSELTGDESLHRRPMNRVIEPLSLMGAAIQSRDGYAPLVIQGRGRLNAINYSLPVASAQIKSAILFAALNAAGETVIHEPQSTRDHTERLFKTLGARLECNNHEIHFHGPQPLHGTRIDIPGDFSSAAFFIAAAAARPGSELLIEGVGVNKTRTGLIDVLREMGAQIELGESRVEHTEPVADVLVKGKRLIGTRVAANMIARLIDEIPALGIAAAQARGRTRITGAGELRVKETDRIQAMVAGLTALGIDARELSDGLEIEGGSLYGGSVDAQGDHRIAMAFAVAGGAATGTVFVSDAGCIDTSYPDFVAASGRLGLLIRVEEEAA